MAGRMAPIGVMGVELSHDRGNGRSWKVGWLRKNVASSEVIFSIHTKFITSKRQSLYSHQDLESKRFSDGRGVRIVYSVDVLSKVFIHTNIQLTCAQYS